MKNLFIHAVLVLAACSLAAHPALALDASTSAASAPAKPQKKPAAKKSAKKAAKKAAKPVYIQGSEETVAQRSARLKRECKGGVNAGACAGYTR
jgi:hypothetical protein